MTATQTGRDMAEEDFPADYLIQVCPMKDMDVPESFTQPEQDSLEQVVKLLRNEVRASWQQVLQCHFS